MNKLEERLDSIFSSLTLPKDKRLIEDVYSLERDILDYLKDRRVMSREDILDRNKIGRFLWIVEKLKKIADKNKTKPKKTLFYTLDDSIGSIEFHRIGSGYNRYVLIRYEGGSLEIPLPKNMSLSKNKNTSGNIISQLVLELKGDGKRRRVTRVIDSIDSFRDCLGDLIELLKEHTGMLNHGGVLRDKNFFLDPFD